MKRITVLLFLLTAFLPWMNAQKKEIAQAEAYIKSGKNIDKAEQLMRKLLNDSANKHNDKIYLTLFDAVRMQYDQGNEKLYLRQKYDTANLFVFARKMFQVLESLDTLDAKPDKKGRVKLKYRHKHSEFLMNYRANLFNGGVFFMRKLRHADAFGYFDSYIDCARQPLFSEQKLDSADARLPLAAYWAVVNAYQTGDYDKTLKHSNLALKDSAHLSSALQYVADTYRMMGNKCLYVETLKRGFSHEPEFPYFFPRLMEYYTEANHPDSALAVVDKVLELNADNLVYLYAKSNVLLNMGKYAESIDICDTLIARNDSLADAYLNAGLSYVNLAVEMDKVSRSKTKRAQVIALYKKARPYMERYRALRPDEEQKWAPVLYNIYLNLNMGKQFDEMDRILKKAK